MISLRNVTKHYGTLRVLDGVTLDIERGEVLCLIGASGSGKSTLLQCINGLEPIDGGTITVDGEDVHAPHTDLNRLRQKLGIVFQQYNAFPHLTVLDNVALALKVVKKVPRAAAEAEAMRQLTYVGLKAKAREYPARLSGGQQQRVAIARALAMQPGYMLFDEITSALDPELVAEVLQSLRQLRADGMSMLIVTHEMQFAREIGDRIAFFQNGNLVEIGPPRQVFDAPCDERTARFVGKTVRKTHPEVPHLDEMPNR